MAKLCTQCGEEIPEESPFGFCPRCGLGRPGTKGEELIEGVELGELIGKGTFGEVYEGIVLDHSLREVAVKILNEAGFERARFLEEMQILALLKHPNIAQMTGSGETRDGRPYYHMEFIEGVPINEYDGDPLPVMIQLVEAVAHAHRNGIIHRDLKPGNVLVSPEGVVKVIDFGIARVVSGPLVVSHVATMNCRLGTPLYMSPEQLEGDPQIDTRTDIYALGLLFYELSLGKPVLAGVVSPERSWAENVAAVRDFPFPTLEPREFHWVARKACAFQRKERYISADAFLADLRSLENGTLVSAGVKTRFYLARRFARKHRQALVVCSLLLAFLVTVTFLSVTMARRDRGAREKIGESYAKLQVAERETRMTASDTRLQEANMALARDDAREALRVVNLALSLNPDNAEATYFRTFLLATRSLAVELPGASFEFQVENIKVHSEGFLVSGEGRQEVVPCDRQWISHPRSDILFVDEQGKVRFESKAGGETLMSPVVYDSREGISGFSPGRGVLATAMQGAKEVRLWDVSEMRSPSARRVMSPPVTWLSFEREKDTLWMVGEEADLHFWPKWSGPLSFGKVEGFGREFFSEVSMTNRRDYLWAFWQGGNQRGMAGGKWENLRAMRAIKEHTRKTNRSLRFSTMARDRDVVLVGDSGGALGIRNEEGGFDFLEGTPKPVKRLAISAAGGVAGVLYKNGEVATFDPMRRQFLARWKPAGDSRSLVFMDSEEVLVIGDETGVMRFFNPMDGKQLGEAVSAGGEGLEMAVIPGRGEILTRSDGDLEVKRWEVSKGRMLSSGMRHVDGVLWFSCSLDGRFLFSIDQKEREPERGFLRVWSLRSGQEIVPALGHQAPVNCATIYQNGRRIATASADGVVRRWVISSKWQ